MLYKCKMLTQYVDHQVSYHFKNIDFVSFGSVPKVVTEILAIIAILDTSFELKSCIIFIDYVPIYYSSGHAQEVN